MRRADVDAFAAWGKHTDPLFRHYDVRALDPGEGDAFWRALAGMPELRRPYAALAGSAVIGSLVVRPAGAATGDVGIVLDPRYIGRGIGRRILAAFSAVLWHEGFRRLRLDVARYNARAIAAYRAAGSSRSRNAGTSRNRGSTSKRCSAGRPPQPSRPTSRSWTAGIACASSGWNAGLPHPRK